MKTRGTWLLPVYLLSLAAYAANYTFPGSMPAGCSGSSGTYTCGTLSLGSSDTITIASPKPAIININGDLTTNVTSINSSGSAADLTLNITGAFNAGYQTVVKANITAGSIADASGFVTYGGNIATSTGSIVLKDQSTVAGSITSTTGAITVGQSDIISGNVSSTSGAIIIGYAAQVTGTVTTSSTVSLSQSSVVSSCVRSTGSNTITLNYQASANAVCCGSGSCGTSCVTNNSTYAMPPACATSTLLGQYRLEESIWNGTANEVTDSSGNNRHAKTIGSPLPSPNTTSPARTGATGTCGYASLPGPFSNGGAIQVDNLPISSSSGSKTSVSFWMYWDGTNNVTPIGFYLYNIWIISGYIGFNTGGNDLYGVLPSGLSNSWHHVVAVFNNGNVSNSTLYIDGVQQTLAQNNVNPTNSNAYVNSKFIVGGWTYNNNYRFSGLIDEVKIYNGALTQTEITALYNETHACPQTSTLIAQYRFEETSWNGTANELKDSSGNNYHGTAIGSPKPGPSTTSPAISGATTGTCGYANMPGPSTGGGAFSISGLPVSTATGAKTTVAFWMYWDGQAWRMPIGWQNYDLYFDGDRGLFGFNTGNSDIYGTPLSGLANSWHHVVAVFTNGSISSNKLYIDGVQKPLTQFGTPSSYSTVVYSTLQVGGWVSSSTWGYITSYRFSGRIDELKIYNGELTSTEITALYSETHACPVTNTGSVASNFNCVEVGGTVNSNLYTKLANTTFNLDVLALNNSGAINTGYVGSTNKNVTLELVEGSGTTACGSRNVLSSALTQTVTFTSANSGRKTVSIGPANTAYADVRCRITDANQSASVIACSSDNFSIRPSSLTVASSANADTTGASTTAIPTFKAGASFSLTATSNVTGYNGTPKIDNTKLAAHLGAAQNGVVSGAFNSANAATGTAANTAFSYSEVGYFRFGANGVYDDTFTSVDSVKSDCTADFSNNLVGGKYGCNFGNTSATSYFGRFIPDHFTAAIASNGSFANACSSFTYNGQTFGYNASHPQLDVFAYNSSNTLTQNYTDSFARLAANQFNITAPTTDAAQKGVDNSSYVNLSASLATPSLSNLGGGRLVLTLGNDTFTYQRENNALIAPFNANIAINTTSIIDSDGVTATNLPITLTPASTSIRYGRISLGNAYGSELLDLAVPMQAEYYDGHSFISNTADVCSVATISIGDPVTTDSLTPGNTCIWDNNSLSGSANCATTAPSGKSYVEGGSLASGSFNLHLKAPGITGSLTVNAVVDNWLTFDWQGPGNINPSASATFGIYKGDPDQIFFREVY